MSSHPSWCVRKALPLMLDRDFLVYTGSPTRSLTLTFGHFFDEKHVLMMLATIDAWFLISISRL